MKYEYLQCIVSIIMDRHTPTIASQKGISGIGSS